MLRTLDIILICAMVAAATITYRIKHNAEEKLGEVRRLEATIRLQEETIDLLKADWALLSQPSRIQRLTEEFADQLQLEPVRPQQMARPEELPGRASDYAPKIARGNASGNLDRIETGSVAQ